MIAGYSFDYGERIEVSDDGKHWFNYPFFGCVVFDSVTQYYTDRTSNWLHARPIRKAESPEPPLTDAEIKQLRVILKGR